MQVVHLRSALKPFEGSVLSIESSVDQRDVVWVNVDGVRGRSQAFQNFERLFAPAYDRVCVCQ